MSSSQNTADVKLVRLAGDTALGAPLTVSARDVGQWDRIRGAAFVGDTSALVTSWDGLHSVKDGVVAAATRRGQPFQYISVLAPRRQWRDVTACTSSLQRERQRSIVVETDNTGLRMFTPAVWNAHPQWTAEDLVDALAHKNGGGGRTLCVYEVPTYVIETDVGMCDVVSTHDAGYWEALGGAEATAVEHADAAAVAREIFSAAVATSGGGGGGAASAISTGTDAASLNAATALLCVCRSSDEPRCAADAFRNCVRDRHVSALRTADLAAGVELLMHLRSHDAPLLESIAHELLQRRDEQGLFDAAADVRAPHALALLICGGRLSPATNNVAHDAVKASLRRTTCGAEFVDAAAMLATYGAYRHACSIVANGAVVADVGIDDVGTLLNRCGATCRATLRSARSTTHEQIQALYALLAAGLPLPARDVVNVLTSWHNNDGNNDVGTRLMMARVCASLLQRL